jgi:hypothetical protein
LVNQSLNIYDDDDKNNLIIETQHMWKVKTKLIPVILGATGTNSYHSEKHQRNTLGKHKIREVQKTAILGTAHTLRKVPI